MSARVNMKRRLLVAALCVLATVWLCGLAFADTDPIVCSMEVSPANLAAPGEVTVTITISNSGDTDMQYPLTLYSPTSEVVADFGDQGSVTLLAGEVKTWTGTWDVNQRTLDNGQIVYFVKYKLVKADGTTQTQSQPIRGKLNATEAKSSIEVKRTISPGTAREGQSVSVQYDIVNTGTVSLLNISITENKDISKKTVTVAKELKAGETAQVKFPVTMGKKDLTSSATIAYTPADTDTKETKTVAEQKIVYGEVDMTALLTSSASGVVTNGTVTLSLELKNKGSVNYTDIRVTDPTLGDVFTNQELAAGGTLKLDKEITLTQTTDYQFTISAIDDTGTEVSLATDPLTLTAVDPDKVVHLTVTVSADRTEVYEQPGIVRFSVTVENDSDVDAKEVAVYHGSTLIYTFTDIPAGQTRKLTRDAALSMAGKYQFTAVTVDALGNSNRFESNEIQIAFSLPTPAPATPTPPLVPTPEPTYAAVTVPPISDPSIGTVAKLVRTFFYPLMLLGIVLLCVALVLLAIATKRRMEQKRASDAALDHLDRAKRRDYVTPGDEPESPPPATPIEAKTGDAASAKGKAKADKVAATAESISEDVELPHMKYVRNAYERKSKTSTTPYSGKSLYDEDPLTGAPAADSDSAYPTYGGESDLFDLPTIDEKGSHASNASDWSAYAKRPARQTPDAVAPDATAARQDAYAAYRRQDAAPESRTERQNAEAEPYAGNSAEGDASDTADAYADYGSGYENTDGYQSDAMGYGGSAGYSAPDGYAPQDGYYGAEDANSNYGEAQVQPYGDASQPSDGGGADWYQPAQTEESAVTSRSTKPEGSRRSRRTGEGRHSDT